MRRRGLGTPSTAARTGAAPAVACCAVCSRAHDDPAHASHPPEPRQPEVARATASDGSPGSARACDVTVASSGVRLRPSLSWPMRQSDSRHSGSEGSRDTDQSARSEACSARLRRRRQQGGDGCGEATGDTAAGAQRAPPHQDSLHWVERVMGAIGSPCRCSLGWYPSEPEPLGSRSAQQSGRRRRHASFSPAAMRSGAATGNCK